MDVCKVNSWVPYKMVALGQGGKCAGGYMCNIRIYMVFYMLYYIAMRVCTHIYNMQMGTTQK